MLAPVGSKSRQVRKVSRSNRNRTIALPKRRWLQFPGVLNGRFDKLGDRDYFKFKAQKGQRVHCVAKSRELGSACDVYLSLHKGDGSKIAEARQERQTVLDADIPDDGEYLLQVEDLFVGGVPGADHVYRIHLSNAFSGFSLQAEALQYSAPQAGTFVVKVLARANRVQRPHRAGRRRFGRRR